MAALRVVSLLPAATEILFQLGVEEDLVAVTFECDHPAEARARHVVSNTTMPPGLSPSEIDAFVTAAVARGDDLYRLDADALRHLEPTLVLTQDLCAVCAVDVDTVDEALDHLGCRAQVVTTDPHTVSEILASIELIGAAVGRPARAREITDDLRARIDAVRARGRSRDRRPRVAVLEWTDPLYAPGHWIPEMVEIAGGICVLGTAGARSERIAVDDVRAADPDLVVVAPCGFDRAGAQAQADALIASATLPVGVPVHAVDANGEWARPGPRIVDGIEELSEVLDALQP